MKNLNKITALLLSAGMVGSLAACGGGNAAQSAAPAGSAAPSDGGDAAVVSKVALVTDVGTIDDESFNQACWQGVEEWSKANGVDYTYYQPTEDSTDARLVSITQAVNEGANVIVMPGYLFGEALATAQDQFPDVKFIAVDVGSGDLGTDAAANSVCITFAEEQAGYLAGYAAVADGYTKLGYLGGMAVPAVQRYGYGYVQGADAAAQALDKDIQINYTYGGQFFGDATITAKMEGWYQNGTEIVFACGGGIYTSAVEAAVQYDGMVIGVDVDQHPVGEAKNEDGSAKYSYNPFLTSAMKGLQATTETALDDLNNGNWDNYGGKFLTMSLAEGDYVGLPTDDASWCFKTFTKDEYQTLVDGIKDGSIAISNDISAMPQVSEHTTVNEIG
ncbi:BMP family protein [Pseudoflavonifractor sp. MSJ-37]|uniref:BMP family lipoprotein n=1 Tax=Pseudoflavonifractor sp. MSJ-37 TaxID=2841531 RepID=UPI0020A089B8|nr:BMP family ABC transporter substrate-binding protein [Pseudoflavonifractor sp. MSJ-37]